MVTPPRELLQGRRLVVEHLLHFTVTMVAFDLLTVNRDCLYKPAFIALSEMISTWSWSS